MSAIGAAVVQLNNHAVRYFIATRGKVAASIEDVICLRQSPLFLELCARIAP